MKRLIFALVIVACTGISRAQDSVPFTPQYTYLDIPLVEWPYQSAAIGTTGGFFASYMNPGMGFSLALSTDLYTLAHWGLQRIQFSSDPWKQQRRSLLAIYGFDLITSWLPLSNSWLHEEYHRAVMTLRGVNSFNEVLLCRIGSSTISVSHETDEEMAMLCDQYHPDFIRLMAAGLEGQTQQNMRMQRDEFFYHQGLRHEVILLVNALNNTTYLAMCGWGYGDKEAREMTAHEPTIAERDFTGMDLMAWAHGLFNPDEPYANRGLHPSGTGIDRYITTDDLSPEAIRYLRRQTWVDLINCISPLMVGIPRINLGSHWGGELYGNFALRHYLTSFGDDNNLELLLQLLRPERQPLNGYLVVHNYNNYRHSFAGLEMGLVDLSLWRGHLLLSTNLHGWLQPTDFYTSQVQAGGSVTLRMAANLGQANTTIAPCVPYLEVGYKSPGWMAGNVYLDATPMFNAGLRWRL
ncbi:MAG: hypothetical protein K6E93_02460 [Bacteroidales bacterium]|nr:hypothetical protein [Bacteroidales bacterium]